MKELRILSIVCLFLRVNLSLQRTTASDPYYVAGVIEFSPFKDGLSQQNILEQLDGIREILEDPETQSPDIIVFPEHILSSEIVTYIPDPKDEITPCEQLDYDYVLSELSCLARMAQKYIVININEKSLCTKNNSCEKGVSSYNTNVVFDRNGTVVSKYRKSHLHWIGSFKEVASEPHTQTFTTDFGVTFGHFLSFDLMFYSPAQKLVDEGVSDYICPSYWYQEFPFLTALQLYQGWAHANNVNLLSAGGSHPQERVSGSGIFAGKHGALATVISETPVRKIVVAKVPKISSSNTFKPKLKEVHLNYSNGIPNRLAALKWKRDFNVDLFATKLLNTSKSFDGYRLCHNDFCCEFSVEFQPYKLSSVVDRRKYEYRIAAFEGPGTLQRMEKAELGICTLMACTNKELWSCGNIFTGSTTVGNDFIFANITIRGEYKKRERLLVMPSTVDSAFEPLLVDSYKYSKRENDDGDSDSEENMTFVTYEISLNRPRYDIITFGLYGNYYVDTKSLHNHREEEGKFEATKNLAAGTSSSFLAVLLVAIAVLFLYS